jgi:2-succinyl-6-hydroxy-2,4-cyclohexadiene-1-carboxylate synthase
MTARVLVNGVHLGVVEGRPEGVPRGTLVLLHGFTGSAAGWVRHLAHFTEQGLRVIAIDMLGHGAAEAPDDPARYAIERCSEDIVTLLHQVGVSAGVADLVGYSMGGRIALFTALSGFFRRLILESASPGIADPAERATRRAADDALAARIEAGGVPAFVEEWERLPLFASQRALPETLRASLHQQRLRNTPRGLANSLRGVGTGTQPALFDRLAELTLPVLLIAGALDAKFTTLARQMAAALPQAEVQIVPDAGHTVHLEQPAAFDALVTEFVGSPHPALPAWPLDNPSR